MVQRPSEPQRAATRAITSPQWSSATRSLSHMRSAPMRDAN
jgi:hypothetical protein